MEKFQEKNNTYKTQRSRLLISFILFFLFIISANKIYAQKIESENIDNVVNTFLKTWLIDGDVKNVLDFISEKPVFPSCWVNNGKSLKWRKTRTGVLKLIKPVFLKLAEETEDAKDLKEEIESQEKKIDYPLVQNKYGDLFDIYVVNDELRRRMILGACEDRKRDDSKFLVNGLKRPKEMYLVLFHFKAGLLVTMLWAKENSEFRLFYLEFPLE